MARLEEIDAVRLKRPVDGFPAGTEGTVIVTGHPEYALVEIVGKDGDTEAFIDVPVHDLEVVEGAERARWWPRSAGRGDAEALELAAHRLGEGVELRALIGRRLGHNPALNRRLVWRRPAPDR